MKTSVSIVFVLFAFFLRAQVVFYGESEPLSALNSPNAQNYLVLHPQDSVMAFTEEIEEIEEISGSGEENPPVVLHPHSSSFVYVFKDRSVQKGMVSPIGFLEKDILYSHVFFEKGKYVTSLFSLEMKTGNRRAIRIPFFENHAPTQSGCLSSEGNYMILSLESNNTYGVEDLYVSRKDAKGNWTSLNNLGARVNTEFQEITPFLASDNKTLFFSTNRRGGLGSFDVYYTIRKDESWRNWSEPVHLGRQINTQGSETSFVFRDGEEWAYFVRSNDSEWYGDIRRIRIETKIEKDTVSANNTKENSSSHRQKTRIRVVDASSRLALAAQLILREDTLFDAKGIFTIHPSDTEEIEIKSRGYFSHVLNASDLMKQVKKEENVIELASIAKGETISLNHVLFLRGTSRFIEGAEKELDLVVELMNENKKIKIKLKGHTDNRGNADLNVRLSEKRVETVKKYLISKGIDSQRVQGKGYGGSQPISSNLTEEHRKINRRVEFEVIAD